jgi:hypothetical protein
MPEPGWRDLADNRSRPCLRRVKDNQYQVSDPPRLVRLQRSERMDPGQYAIEVQLPVKLQTK